MSEAVLKSLRAKMGTYLRSDDEARMMLLGLMLNPAVQQFARQHAATPSSGRPANG